MEDCEELTSLMAMTYEDRSVMSTDEVETVGGTFTRCVEMDNSMVPMYAFIYMWDKQTPAEKDGGTALERNAEGFDKYDSARASDIVDLLKGKSTLPPRVIDDMHDFATKYRSQIIRKATDAEWSDIISTDDAYFVEWVDKLSDEIPSMSVFFKSNAPDDQGDPVLHMVYRNPNNETWYKKMKRVDNDHGKTDVECTNGSTYELIGEAWVFEMDTLDELHANGWELSNFTCIWMSITSSDDEEDEGDKDGGLAAPPVSNNDDLPTLPPRRRYRQLAMGSVDRDDSNIDEYQVDGGSDTEKDEEEEEEEDEEEEEENNEHAPRMGNRRMRREEDDERRPVKRIRPSTYASRSAQHMLVELIGRTGDIVGDETSMRLLHALSGSVYDGMLRMWSNNSG